MRSRSALLAMAALFLLATAPPPADSVPDTEPRRVIIRLSDRTARASLLAEATSAGVPLAARHTRVVRGLHAIHDASLADARPVLERAVAAGGLVELDRLWAVNAVVAEVDPAWIDALEGDPSVAAVVPDRRLTLGDDRHEPVPGAAQDPSAAISQIGVPAAWAQGITGKGAIVANVDTGVNGDDETLEERWRGRFAGSDATWYSPVALTVFPIDTDMTFSGGFGHGTAVMGLLSGGDESFGVAFDATWMAGDVFEEGEGFVSNALKIFQWMIDPDGDPTTDGDVPDVVNNSYGLGDIDPETQRIRCDPIFDDAIDALEAAGAIVIWSAGNAGQSGVTSPANRADTPVNAFAVGAVDDLGADLAFSGRGPSSCGGMFATKPEIVAPGQNVLTRNRFGAFTRVTGTSFSTPLVGGVLALMRSKNPTITPEEAKTILLETARDLEAPGDDNVTGFGLVDAEAALSRVERPSSPLARLVGFGPSVAPSTKLVPAGIEEALVLRPGDTQALVPLLSNHGPSLPTSIATLSSPTPGVTVTRAEVPLEAAGTGEFFGSPAGESFQISLAPDVPMGTPVALDVAVSGASIGPFRLVVKAGQPVPGDFATHDAGRIRLSVTNFGGLGFYTGLHMSGFVLRGEGFRFPPESPNWLFHASFMAGTGPRRVSDDVPYGDDTQAATDWIPLFGAPIATDQASGGQRITAAYDDRRAFDPLALEVRQESFTFPDPDRDDFAILRYTVTNRDDRCRSGLRAGVFADWDLPGEDGDAMDIAGWNGDALLGHVRGTLPDQPWLGVTLLQDTSRDRITYAVLRRSAVEANPLGDPPSLRAPAPATAPQATGTEFSDAEKWNALASGLRDTLVTQPQDLYQILGVGPFGLPAGASQTLGFALVAAEDSSGLVDAARRARDTFRGLGANPTLPSCPAAETLRLRQNYPNPFRAGGLTTLEFDVPASEEGTRRVTLAVYDVAGQRVRTLVDDVALNGAQEVTWDGTDASGRAVPAGVYVARLSAGGEQTIRMLVVP